MLALGDDWDVDFEMLRGLQKWFHLAPYLGLWHDSYFHAGHVVSIIYSQELDTLHVKPCDLAFF